VLWKRIALVTGRLAVTAFGIGTLALIGVQFEGILAKNVAVAADLRASRAQIASLVAKEAVQRRTIARLANPQGAVPEIHDKLRLVGPNEEIIYIRGQAPGSQTPRQWNESQ
jgi:cell division protein FtsB